MAQRLVRTLCTKCREAYLPQPADLPDDFPLDQLDGQGIYRPKGCRACRNVGYLGRIGLFELLVTTEEVRQLAHERAGTWAMKKAAAKAGMKTLRQDGWRKVLAGRTTVEEVVRVTKGDHVGM
jgi:general secretion pathway protein E/type IV pilus assembly protein PilB